MGFRDVLGHKPARIAAWEVRQQARFEADAARHRAWVKRNPEVTFEGKTIYVRSAAPAESLIDWRGMGWGGGGEAITRLPEYFRDVRARRDDAWTVGIVVRSRFLYEERVVHREYLADEADVQPAVDRLALEAAAGRFSRRRRGRGPKLG